MRRRDVLLACATALAAPVAARAQSAYGGGRRLGVLIGLAADDSTWTRQWNAFTEALGKLGWAEGRNLEVDFRTTAGDPKLADPYASELVAKRPDLILSQGPLPLAALARATKSIPILFTIDNDPVGEGIISNVSRPGGNITGFTDFEFSISGKWLQLLEELRPNLARVLVLFHPEENDDASFYSVLQQAAGSLAVTLTKVPVHDDAEMRQAITGFSSSGGLIVLPSAFMLVHRTAIVEAAAANRLPAVYWHEAYVLDGGLISYMPDQLAEYRHAAAYADRILRGEKAGDLPIQAPTEFKLTINRKAADAAGIIIPSLLLARADQVIE